MGLSCRGARVLGLLLFLTPWLKYYVPPLALALASFLCSPLGGPSTLWVISIFSVIWNIPALPFSPSWLSSLYSRPLSPTGLFLVTIHHISRDTMCLHRVPHIAAEAPSSPPTALSLMIAPCVLRTLIDPTSSLSKASLLFLCNVSHESCTHSTNVFWVKPGTVLDTGIK